MQTNGIDHILALLLTSCDLWLLFSNYIYFYFIKKCERRSSLGVEVQSFPVQIRRQGCPGAPIDSGLEAMVGLRCLPANQLTDVPHIFSAIYHLEHTIIVIFLT